MRLIATLVLLSAATPSSAADPGLELFENKIRPVLVKHCYECHSADGKKVKGGLLVDSHEGLLKGGDSGPALGLGKVEDYEPPAWPNPHGSKQFHLDLAADDIDVETERLVGLGARLADPQPGETWRVLLDPAGHPFCVTNAANWG